MEKKTGRCQYYYKNLVSDTWPDPRLAIPLRRYWWDLKKVVLYISILGFRRGLPRVFLIMRPISARASNFLYRSTRKTGSRRSGESLSLKAGDWVEVRTAKEIFATLDQKYALRGLVFTPEMLKFCGKRFRVYKKLDKIILEATGELRKIKSPTVLLENAFCDGKAHGECDRSCFCFWREEWLKKVS